MPSPVVYWDGPGRPTAAELRAIARAYRRGEIPAGSHISRACAYSAGVASGPGRARARVRRRARPNPEATPAEYAYRDFHWGKPPKRRKVHHVPTPLEVFELGKLRAVEYETTKGNEHAIWFHEFGWPRPSLTGTADGQLGPILGGSARVTKRGIEG